MRRADLFFISTWRGLSASSLTQIVGVGGTGVGDGHGGGGGFDSTRTPAISIERV
jgi:hypothetical protein